ncbi:MAG: hypothetical protein JSV92_01585 [archaeon]|nr:MAG: hypothetical protein JSV92_01585 [archaeon]
MLEVIGILGAAFILIAWILGLVDELKKRENLIELRFSLVSLLGTVILIYYSSAIGNTVFLFLNLGIFFVVIFEIAYTVYLVKYRYPWRDKK